MTSSLLAPRLVSQRGRRRSTGGRGAPARVYARLGLAALLLLAACQAGAPTPPPATPTATPQPSPTATATERATAETTERAAASEGGGETTGLQGAAEALSQVDSYRFELSLSGTAGLAGLPASNAIRVSGTAVFEPEEALDASIEGVAGLGAFGGGNGEPLKVRIIGDDVFVGLAGDVYFPVPTEEGDESGFAQLFDALRPQALLGSYAAGVEGLEVVGEETRNGVESVHLRADEETRRQLAAALASGGVPDVDGGSGDEFEMEAWVARRGGYLVAFEMGAPEEAEDGFRVALDISGINDPANVVERP